MRAGSRGRVIDAALWALSVSALLAIVVLSVDRDPLLVAGRWDKLAHSVAYATLTGAFLLATVWRPGPEVRPVRRSPAVTVAAAMALAIALELVQWPLPGRSAEVADALSGIGGVIVGWAGWRVLRAVAEGSEMRDPPPGG